MAPDYRIITVLQCIQIRRGSNGTIYEADTTGQGLHYMPHIQESSDSSAVSKNVPVWSLGQV